MQVYKKFGKRLIDIVVSACGLLLLAPVFLVLAVAVKLDSPGPALFLQKRVGVHKTHFNILKFRTMRNDSPKDCPTHLMEDPERWQTRVGGFLRKTSLDEIPQLVNILTGDMSLVGPRPALWNQFDLLEERDKYGANDIVPGLTGWAQINGRDELSIQDKAKLDGEYVKKMSFRFDMKCLFRSVFYTLRQEGFGKPDAEEEDT